MINKLFLSLLLSLSLLFLFAIPVKLFAQSLPAGCQWASADPGSSYTSCGYGYYCQNASGCSAAVAAYLNYRGQETDGAIPYSDWCL